MTLPEIGEVATVLALWLAPLIWLATKIDGLRDHMDGQIDGLRDHMDGRLDQILLAQATGRPIPTEEPIP